MDYTSGIHWCSLLKTESKGGKEATIAVDTPMPEIPKNKLNFPKSSEINKLDKRKRWRVWIRNKTHLRDSKQEMPKLMVPQNHVNPTLSCQVSHRPWENNIPLNVSIF